MKIEQLAQAREEYHELIITDLTFRTISRDMDKVLPVVKVMRPYENLYNSLLKQLDNELKMIKSNLRKMGVNTKLDYQEIDEYVVVYKLLVKNESHDLRYMKVALKNQVESRMNFYFNKNSK